jgi:hypothetical protein
MWLCVCVLHLVGDTNHTTSRTRSSVSSLLGLLVSTLTEVISAAVNDNGALYKALVLGHFQSSYHSDSKGWNRKEGVNIRQ